MDMVGSPGESVASPSMRKHKRHKRDRYEDDSHDGSSLEKPGGLKLILKVGGQNTPEHNPGKITFFIKKYIKLICFIFFQKTKEFQYTGQFAAEQSELLRSHHKKSKKKKKKKDRSKDKERKHKHHHKDKKRKREDVSMSENDATLTGFTLTSSTSSLSGVPTLQAVVPPTLSLPIDIEDIKEDENSLSSPKPDMAQLGSPYREPRTCVIKKIQERNTVQRMLEHFLKAIEKKDPQQFFAWPVTDNIAPGYSTIISNPMDCSTMRQKIDDNEYRDLPVSDFIRVFSFIERKTVKKQFFCLFFY